MGLGWEPEDYIRACRLRCVLGSLAEDRHSLEAWSELFASVPTSSGEDWSRGAANGSGDPG
jgi:hypothetical protein